MPKLALGRLNEQCRILAEIVGMAVLLTRQPQVARHCQVIWKLTWFAAD